MHNSRRPLNRLTLTFDLILIGGRGIMMDYPSAKFGDFILRHFGFIVQTHTHTHTQRITDGDDCFTRATTVGVSTSNYNLTVRISYNNNNSNNSNSSHISI